MPYPIDNPLDGRGGEVAAGRPAMPDPDALIEALADALVSCIVRLDDLGEGDGPTAQVARAALRSAGR